MSDKLEEKNEGLDSSVDRFIDCEWWRDLLDGEEILLGDRFLDSAGAWVIFEDKHLEFNKLVNPCSRVCQRNKGS